LSSVCLLRQTFADKNCRYIQTHHWLHAHTLYTTYSSSQNTECVAVKSFVWFGERSNSESKTALKTTHYYPISTSDLNPMSVHKPYPQRYRSTVVFKSVSQVQTHNFSFVCYSYVPSANNKITHPVTSSPLETGIYRATNYQLVIRTMLFSSPVHFRLPCNPRLF
jgi:hypothetical protein